MGIQPEIIICSRRNGSQYIGYESLEVSEVEYNVFPNELTFHNVMFEYSLTFLCIHRLRHIYTKKFPYYLCHTIKFKTRLFIVYLYIVYLHKPSLSTHIIQSVVKHHYLRQLFTIFTVMLLLFCDNINVLQFVD